MMISKSAWVTCRGLAYSKITKPCSLAWTRPAASIAGFCFAGSVSIAFGDYVEKRRVAVCFSQRRALHTTICDYKTSFEPQAKPRSSQPSTPCIICRHHSALVVRFSSVEKDRFLKYFYDYKFILVCYPGQMNFITGHWRATV
jgi:hypothetical protein